MKCAIVPEWYEDVVASQNFIVIRLGQDSPLKVTLLYAFLRQPAIQDRFLNRTTGTTLPSLNIRDLESLVVPIPPQDMQPDLVRFVSAAEDQYRVAAELARLRHEESMDILAQYMEPDHES